MKKEYRCQPTTTTKTLSLARSATAGADDQARAVAAQAVAAQAIGRGTQAAGREALNHAARERLAGHRWSRGWSYNLGLAPPHGKPFGERGPYGTDPSSVAD